MPKRQDIFTLVGRRMRSPRVARTHYESPVLTDLISRIDRALLERPAA